MKKTLRSFSRLLFLLTLNHTCAPETWAHAVAGCEVAAPTVQAGRDSSCAGRPGLLWAKGCAGTTRWSNGATGSELMVSAQATLTARCE